MADAVKVNFVDIYNVIVYTARTVS
jgi:hypothetical protein